MFQKLAFQRPSSTVLRTPVVPMKSGSPRPLDDGSEYVSKNCFSKTFFHRPSNPCCPDEIGKLQGLQTMECVVSRSVFQRPPNIKKALHHSMQRQI